MSTKLKDKQDKLQQLFSKLSEASAKGKPIVVEGKKDELALRELGICGLVVTVKTGGKSFLQATAEIENLNACEVILLLDFDRRGKEGTLRLKQDLERKKIKVNSRFSVELEALIGRDVSCIESLPSYLLTLEQKVA